MKDQSVVRFLDALRRFAGIALIDVGAAIGAGRVNRKRSLVLVTCVITARVTIGLALMKAGSKIAGRSIEFITPADVL